MPHKSCRSRLTLSDIAVLVYKYLYELIYLLTKITHCLPFSKEVYCISLIAAVIAAAGAASMIT